MEQTKKVSGVQETASPPSQAPSTENMTNADLPDGTYTVNDTTLTESHTVNTELERLRQERDEYESQYQHLVDKVAQRRTPLGDRLRQDAVSATTFWNLRTGRA